MHIASGWRASCFWLSRIAVSNGVHLLLLIVLHRC